MPRGGIERIPDRLSYMTWFTNLPNNQIDAKTVHQNFITLFWYSIDEYLTWQDCNAELANRKEI